MKKNWLTTVGGIMAGFGVVPIAFGGAKIPLPGWLYVLCIFLAAIGPVVIGVAAKGQDEHSTIEQVNQSSQDADSASPSLPAIAGQKSNGGSQK